MSTTANAAGVPPKPAWIPGQFAHPREFWIGVALITAGILSHFFEFTPMHARAVAGAVQVTGIGFFGALGLTADVLGLVLCAYGLFPPGWIARWKASRRAALEAEAPDADVTGGATLAAMDSSRLTGTHWKMLTRLFVGVALDTMKPATLGFLLPGMRAEYHLSAAQVSIYPLSALIGLTTGSVLFGSLGDIIGRRATFILTAMVLAATSFCGFMPAFPYHLAFCFVMGLAAGGELPVVYTLLAETMPARHRGWISVATGGAGAVAGFFAASMAAYFLEPIFSWRILWFPNLPTALFMLLLVRWVPESPRFLIQTGHLDEARKVMAAIGVRLDQIGEAISGPVEKRGFADLLRDRLRPITGMLCLYGFAWGLCNWGFITWLPTMLRSLGLQPTAVSGLLATSAVFAFPGTLVAAALYGFWSSKRAAVICALGTSGVLGALALTQPIVAQHPEVLGLTVVGLLVAANSMIGVLTPYSVELYPTALRSAGSGVVAGSSKAGGLVGPLAVGAILTAAPGIAAPAIAVGIPIGIAGLVMARRGRETRGRRLEELTAATELVTA